MLINKQIIGERINTVDKVSCAVGCMVQFCPHWAYGRLEAEEWTPWNAVVPVFPS